MNKSFFNNDLKTNSAWWPEQNCKNNYDRDDYGVTESFLISWRSSDFPLYSGVARILGLGGLSPKHSWGFGALEGFFWVLMKLFRDQN